MKPRLKRVIFAVVLAVLMVGLLEVGLRILSLASPKVDWMLSAAPAFPQPVPDAHFGHRPDPAHPGHDPRGFRNPGVPPDAHIVALGDSQTYGTGVSAEDAWPMRLKSITEKRVYSMAFGGYGPVHSLLLWNEVSGLQPGIVIEAFYAGNDLYDSFDIVYNGGKLPALKNPDPQIQAAVHRAEQSEPLMRRVARMSMMEQEQGSPSQASDNCTLRGLLSDHSKVYGVLRRAKHETARLVRAFAATPQREWEDAMAFADAHPEFSRALSNEQFKTILTSEYRLTALRLEDPRIEEGLRIALEAMRRMHEHAVDEEIRFLVLLLPTKEAVFRELSKSPSTSYRTLIEQEERVWTIAKEFLEHHGIEYVDSLPILREQFGLGTQPYQVSHDGHPNEVGHQAIAELVAARLEDPMARKPKTRSAEAEEVR